MRKQRTRSDAMRGIMACRLRPDQAALWFLGQAGYILRCGDVTAAIDPYLSDSVGKASPEFARALPVPLDPGRMKVDLFIVTHDHLDHLDPDTISAYRHKATTRFIAPRLACGKLRSLGIPPRNVRCVDSGQTARFDGVSVTGVYAVPNEPRVIDTAGYLLEFANGRSVYHTSDTGFSDLLLAAAPRAEVLLTCINGKWGNLSAEQAAKLTARVRPRFAIPNHYDVMALNSENPATFACFARRAAGETAVKVLGILEPFCWADPE